MKPETVLIEKESRDIFIWGEINYFRIQKAICALKSLVDISLDPINIYINSDGGSLDATIGLLDEMKIIEKKHGVVISTIVHGLAFSCGAFILIWGSKGHRCATRNSGVMLHEISFSLDDDAYEKNARASLFMKKQIDDFKKQCAILCGKKTLLQQKRFYEDLKDSIWLTAKEAKRYGIIDKVL